jgi:hypothetical protein
MSRRTTRRHRGGSDWTRFFPAKAGVDRSTLQMTPEGIYSITKPADGQLILRAMTHVIGSLRRRTLTDVTGNVGGDTILFAHHCKHVHSIEWNPENFAALAHNVSVYGLDNVTLYQGDSTQIYTWETDILYCDPPWGGPRYKEHAQLDLVMGTQRVDLWLAHVVQQPWRPRWIVLKLPRNYAFERLDAIPNLTDLYHVPVRGFDLVILAVQH